jgi:hypothetical protein
LIVLIAQNEDRRMKVSITVLTLILLVFHSKICLSDQSPIEKARLSLKEAEDFCVKEGYEFRLSANPFVTADLGGTPEPEVIFDYGALMCIGGSWSYRGSMGATVDLYTREAEVGYLSPNSYELTPFEGHWAVKFRMHPSFKDAQCFDNCCRYVYSANNAFEELYTQC